MVIDYPYVMEHKIMVIGYGDHKWYIDPPIEDIRSYKKLWVLGKQPLFRLAWDPTHYQWTNTFIGNNFFFRNSVQLGRHILPDSWDVLPTTFQYSSE